MNEESELTESVIRRFNSAINDHDIDAVMDLMSEDCIFENTFPAPDGTRHVGQSMVRKELGDFLLSSPLAYFQEEELARVKQAEEESHQKEQRYKVSPA